MKLALLFLFSLWALFALPTQGLGGKPQEEEEQCTKRPNVWEVRTLYVLKALWSNGKREYLLTLDKADGKGTLNFFTTKERALEHYEILYETVERLRKVVSVETVTIPPTSLQSVLSQLDQLGVGYRLNPEKRGELWTWDYMSFDATKGPPSRVQ
jgi:hypothetical protein